MATVSALLTDLGNSLNDPNEDVFTSVLKLLEMNRAQNELVRRLMAFSEQYEGIYDLLTEITSKDTLSVGTSGTALSGLTARNILRGGLINSRITIGGVDRFVTRLPLGKIGVQANSFLKGSDEDPVCFIETDLYQLDISAGSYPQTVTIWYVGEPYTMAAAASGSGKTQLVATPDLNVLLHDVIVRIAERELRRGRGTQTDFAEAKEIEAQVNTEIQSLVRGDKTEPKVQEQMGEYAR